MMNDDLIFQNEEFDENIPYISLDLGIEDISLITESVRDAAKNCHHDSDKKESLETLDGFLTRIMLEYRFRVE
tara:strand:+ start:153 stop:371 length:219 start_codon:yes stop_codon:yes gene_type:complete